MNLNLEFYLSCGNFRSDSGRLKFLVQTFRWIWKPGWKQLRFKSNQEYFIRVEIKMNWNQIDLNLIGTPIGKRLRIWYKIDTNFIRLKYRSVEDSNFIITQYSQLTIQIESYAVWTKDPLLLVLTCLTGIISNHLTCYLVRVLTRAIHSI